MTRQSRNAAIENAPVKNFADVAPPPTELKTGRVKFFNEEKGFGFIVADDGSRDVFFHDTIVKRSKMDSKPKTDEAVRYRAEMAPNGKGPQAIFIERL